MKRSRKFTCGGCRRLGLTFGGLVSVIYVRGNAQRYVLPRFRLDQSSIRDKPVVAAGLVNLNFEEPTFGHGLVMGANLSLLLPRKLNDKRNY
jgi:hypothetical protein